MDYFGDFRFRSSWHLLTESVSEKQGSRKKIQLLIYAPNFISVIVLCGMVRMFLITGRTSE